MTVHRVTESDTTEATQHVTGMSKYTKYMCGKKGPEIYGGLCMNWKITILKVWLQKIKHCWKE